MEKLRFTTNINCGGCVAKVTPFLNAEKGIKEWAVDTADPKKILTVQTDQMTGDEVMKLLNKAGFKAEKV
ncbi:heavy-metal-associated domain-containing protein [Flavitalea flava]